MSQQKVSEVKFADPRTPARVMRLMRDHGYKQQLSQTVLAAAFELAQPVTERARLSLEARDFFSAKAALVPQGLDDLPSCWLSVLPKQLWATRKAEWHYLPYMIEKLRVEQGVLCLTFAQELPNTTDRLTRWDELRVRLNLSLQPNLWTALTRELEHSIWRHRPHLRSELFCLPD